MAKFSSNNLINTNLTEATQNKLLGWLLKLVIPAFTKLLWALAPLIPNAVAEWVEESQSPDGWTKVERYRFVHEELTKLQASPATDAITDKLIGFLLKVIEGKIEDLEGNAPPEEPLPLPTPDDYYYQILTEKPPLDKLVPGAVGFSDPAEELWFVIKAGIGVPLPAGFVERFRIPYPA